MQPSASRGCAAAPLSAVAALQPLPAAASIVVARTALSRAGRDGCAWPSRRDA
jgi:hypothetical protein